jgi:hypothetical protein
MPHGKIVFNRKIALDLMVINGNYLLHVVDTDTGFGAAQYLRGQSTEDVWATFIECWAAVYSGMPNIMGTDQGSCFMAERWKELAGENGIEMQLNRVQAHNALGIGESYHAPLRRIVNKIDCSTPGMATETALKLAFKTMNDTMGPSGLVSSYLVFGSLPRFPASATSHPDQETRFAALQAARLEMESIVAGLRVDTALWTQLPEARDIAYKPADQVMVWREELRYYVGPKTIDKVSEDRVYILDDDGIDDGTGVYTKQYSTAQCKRYQEDSDGGQFMNELNSRFNNPRSGLASNEFTIHATELLDSTDPRTLSPEAEAAKKKEIEQLIERGTCWLALSL